MENSFQLCLTVGAHISCLIGGIRLPQVTGRYLQLHAADSSIAPKPTAQSARPYLINAFQSYKFKMEHVVG